MAKVRFKISMSLDGFVAGPNQSVENPLGVDGMRLHEWVFPLAVFRKTHGLGEGGEVNESTQVIEESLVNVGATVMGRNMFGGGPGNWNPSKPGTAGGGAILRFTIRSSCSRTMLGPRSSSKGAPLSILSPKAWTLRSSRRDMRPAAKTSRWVGVPP